MGSPRQLEQFDQLPLLIRSQMSHLPLVHLHHITSKLLQKLLTDGRQPCQDHSPIDRLPNPFNQPAFFEPVEHACHIGTAGDQESPQLHRLHPVRWTDLQETQHVVLLR